MQLTLWLFRCEVFSFRIGPPDDDDDEPTRAAALESYPISFVGTYERPDEASHLPDRDPGE